MGTGGGGGIAAGMVAGAYQIRTGKELPFLISDLRYQDDGVVIGELLGKDFDLKAEAPNVLVVVTAINRNQALPELLAKFKLRKARAFALVLAANLRPTEEWPDYYLVRGDREKIIPWPRAGG